MTNMDLGIKSQNILILLWELEPGMNDYCEN
jgi:hypothetical protein